MRISKELMEIWLNEVCDSLRVVNHFSSRITFHSPLLSSPEDIHEHIQHLNQVFCQNAPHNMAIVVDSRVKKSNVAYAIAHIWYDNHITKQL